jgi:PhoH-like ATPase
VESKNLRQTVALHHLLDPDIAAVSIMGMAGTGKTFLSLAAALEQVLEQGRYRRVSVYRPLVAVGRQEVGYLPGDLNEKLSPWMAAVHDNLYALFSDAGVEGAKSAIDELIDRGELEMAAVTYLRGRSITGEFVIIDEAQNLELSTLKVILTRMSRDSKVVFCGDLSQVDNPYISPYGGMAALIEKFKGRRCSVTWPSSARSDHRWPRWPRRCCRNLTTLPSYLASRSRRATSSSAAFSMVMDSGSSPLRSEAFTSPSVT